MLMEVLNKLVKKNLLKNKQRTIVSIIGIILSCALITALFGLVVSLQETLIQNSIKTYGNRHVTFESVPKDEIDDIKNHKNVESYYFTNTKTSLIDEKYVGIIGLDKTGINELKNKIASGRVPNNLNEIVIDAVYADDNKVKIGDEITVTTGNRYIDGYLLDDYNAKTEEEIFKELDTKTYKVVGISSYYSYLSSNYGFNFYIADNEIADKSDVYVLYNDPKNYDKITAEINFKKEDSKFGRYNVRYNRDYLRWSGYGIGNNTKGVLYGLAGIVSVIIILTSVFCIRNSFAISVSEKTRTFGMLSSMGATPKQIKRNVLKEAFYLGIIGVPLGILLGILASYILVLIVGILLTNIQSSDFDFIYKISVESILLASILSSITIYLSAIGSAKRASKITEIEAIRNQKEIKLSNKKLKTPKIIRMLFKTGGVIAYKNMKRNKSKYRTTIIALAISITAFISISYFIQVGLKETGEYLGDLSFNMSVNTIDDNPSTIELHTKIFNHISKMKNVDSFNILQSKQAKLDEKYIQNSELERNLVYIYSVSKEEYDRFLDRANLKYENVKDKGIVVLNTYRIEKKDNTKEVKKIINENIKKIEYIDFEGNYKGSMDIIFSDEKFMGIENHKDNDLFGVLVCEEYFNKIDLKSYYDSIFINSNNPRELKNSIKEYDKELECDLYVADISELAKIQNTIVLLVSIFLYGFIAVITLIGLTNVFNTITTNMMLRKREFAILKSTGMTNKEFKNMIRFESLFYGVKSLFYGLILGIALSYLMFYVIISSNVIVLTDKFVPPYFSIIISAIFVFIIIGLIMRYSLSKINKQNIIETIRNENI